MILGTWIFLGIHGKTQKALEQVRAVFQKMAMTASRHGLGVGGETKTHLTGLQGQLCAFGAGAFKGAGAVSQAGGPSQRGHRQLHLPPEPTPGDLFFWETLVQPLGWVVQSQGRSCPISRPRIF